MTATNDNAPAWQGNILACYPYLLERLRTVPQIYQVLEAQEFAAITGNERRQIPSDGAVYVVLDSFTPTDDNAKGSEQDIEIGFSIILTKQQVTPSPATDGVGQTLYAIAKAMQGYDPSDEQGRALTAEPFKQRKPLPIRYENGFAYFPLRFTTSVAVVQD
jgi:hypothetical protein